MLEINNPLVIEWRIDEYIRKNSFKLFHTNENDSLIALFDKRGFWFDKKTNVEYKKIMSKPHLYIAFSKNKEGYIYIGMSNQNRGRWQRGHSYHLGTLAHTILGTTKSYDQDHKNWVNSWMRIDTLIMNDKVHSIELKNELYISFIPFELYEKEVNNISTNFTNKEVNEIIEEKLIHFYKKRGYNLLNVNHNK
jgi:hypothetical protein